MTDKKISELTSNGTLDGSELVELVQSGSNVKALLSAVKTWIINDLVSTTALTNGLLANLTPTINTQPGTAYTVNTVSADNEGKTILRMTSASANTVTIPSSLTLPISIRQAGTGTTTLQAGSGVTLNGTLAFTAQHQTKTIVPLGSGIYDVVG